MKCVFFEAFIGDGDLDQQIVRGGFGVLYLHVPVPSGQDSWRGKGEGCEGIICHWNKLIKSRVCMHHCPCLYFSGFLSTLSS